MDASRLAYALLVFALLASASVAARAAQPAAFSQSTPGAALPADWSIQAIPKVAKQTRFDLVRDGDDVVLRMRADAAAASLRTAVSVDPTATPLLSWRWKTDHVLEGADMTRKDGDDYALRLYVFFDRKPSQMTFGERALYRIGRARYGEQLPAAALCYVWDNRQPVDAIRDNAYTGFVRMVVASSGSGRQGEWVALRRNVADDYRRAFGSAPPPITGVALAADTDNTGESTVSYVGDLRFTPSPAADHAQ